MVKTTYTLAEVAAMLNCHVDTLRRSIKDGSLRAARLGRDFRISRADLEAFWVVQGGGALFGEDALTVASGTITPETPQKRPQKPKSSQQLSLFISEERS